MKVIFSAKHLDIENFRGWDAPIPLKNHLPNPVKPPQNEHFYVHIHVAQQTITLRTFNRVQKFLRWLGFYSHFTSKTYSHTLHQLGLIDRPDEIAKDHFRAKVDTVWKKHIENRFQEPLAKVAHRKESSTFLQAMQRRSTKNPPDEQQIPKSPPQGNNQPNPPPKPPEYNQQDDDSTKDPLPNNDPDIDTPPISPPDDKDTPLRPHPLNNEKDPISESDNTDAKSENDGSDVDSTKGMEPPSPENSEDDRDGALGDSFIFVNAHKESHHANPATIETEQNTIPSAEPIKEEPKVDHSKELATEKTHSAAPISPSKAEDKKQDPVDLLANLNHRPENIVTWMKQVPNLRYSSYQNFKNQAEKSCKQLHLSEENYKKILQYISKNQTTYPDALALIDQIFIPKNITFSITSWKNLPLKDIEETSLPLWQWLAWFYQSLQLRLVLKSVIRNSFNHVSNQKEALQWVYQHASSTIVWRELKTSYPEIANSVITERISKQNEDAESYYAGPSSIKNPTLDQTTILSTIEKSIQGKITLNTTLLSSQEDRTLALLCLIDAMRKEENATHLSYFNTAYDDVIKTMVALPIHFTWADYILDKDHKDLTPQCYFEQYDPFAALIESVVFLFKKYPDSQKMQPVIVSLLEKAGTYLNSENIKITNPSQLASNFLRKMIKILPSSLPDSESLVPEIKKIMRTIGNQADVGSGVTKKPPLSKTTTTSPRIEAEVSPMNPFDALTELLPTYRNILPKKVTVPDPEKERQQYSQLKTQLQNIFKSITLDETIYRKIIQCFISAEKSYPSEQKLLCETLIFKEVTFSQASWINGDPKDLEGKELPFWQWFTLLNHTFPSLMFVKSMIRRNFPKNQQKDYLQWIYDHFKDRQIWTFCQGEYKTLATSIEQETEDAAEENTKFYYAEPPQELTSEKRAIQQAVKIFIEKDPTIDTALLSSQNNPIFAVLCLIHEMRKEENIEYVARFNTMYQQILNTMTTLPIHFSWENPFVAEKKTITDLQQYLSEYDPFAALITSAADLITRLPNNNIEKSKEFSLIQSFLKKALAYLTSDRLQMVCNEAIFATKAFSRVLIYRRTSSKAIALLWNPIETALQHKAQDTDIGMGHTTKMIQERAHSTTTIDDID